MKIDLLEGRLLLNTHSLTTTSENIETFFSQSAPHSADTLAIEEHFDSIYAHDINIDTFNKESTLLVNAYTMTPTSDKIENCLSHQPTDFNNAVIETVFNTEHVSPSNTLKTETVLLVNTYSPTPTCENINDFLTNQPSVFEDAFISKAYTAGHISNLGTLIRVSTLPTINAITKYKLGHSVDYQDFTKGCLWLIEGGAYILEYYLYDLQKHAYEVTQNTHPIDESKQAEEYHDASWSQATTSVWLGLWGAEAIFYILSHNVLKQIPGNESLQKFLIFSIPVISNTLLLKSLYYDWTVLENSRLQQTLTERITPHPFKDPELKQIISFINDAQEPHEARFLMACDTAKFIGNLATITHQILSFYQSQHTHSCAYLQTLATSTIWAGSLGYLMYGVSQIIEWAWDQYITHSGRYNAAIHLLEGDQEAAKIQLLGSDPYFIMQRLIERLQSENTQAIPLTTVYLQALGVNLEALEHLNEAEASDPKVQTYLAEQLNIYI